MNFDEMNIDPKILRGIEDMGFEEATLIQAKAIPAMLKGQDIIGQAQTGTGKTASFGIPLIQMADPSIKKTQAIILSPTRELAIQVADELRKLAKYMHGIKVLPVYGGQEITKQIRSLKGGTQIIVGTPGRIMDHLRRRTIKTEFVKTIVLDEADEMLNMGFIDDIKTILEYVPKNRQTVLFSATMPKQILDITKKFQNNAKHIKIVKKELTVPNIEQYYYDVKRYDKTEILTRLLDYYNPKLSLVFCNTKRMVDEITGELKGRGYFAEGLHGDMKQSSRDRVMKNFREGKAEILVATDVAARGIDVDDVEAVFNYDIPQDDEYYVHRIGRTGRAGRGGKAFNFVRGREVYKLKEIQRYCKTKILARQVPSAEDIEKIRAQKVLEKLAPIIEEENLSKPLSDLEEYINITDYTAMDIAAAFLRLAVEGDKASQIGEYDFSNTGAQEGMVRLFINIGRRQGVWPADILGAIAGETKIPGKLVGAIDIYDKYTFVEVPREYAADVLRAMSDVKIKGKSINIEPANKK